MVKKLKYKTITVYSFNLEYKLNIKIKNYIMYNWTV